MVEEKKPTGTSALTKLLATCGTALITFFAGLVWNAYEKTVAGLQEMTERVKALEEDKFKWGTLTEIHNKTISMEIEMSRQAGMMQGFSLAVQGGMVEKPAPTMIPILPKPSPALRPPEELFRDADEYRRLQQQKYPVPNVQQRK